MGGAPFRTLLFRSANAHDGFLIVGLVMFAHRLSRTSAPYLGFLSVAHIFLVSSRPADVTAPTDSIDCFMSRLAGSDFLSYFRPPPDVTYLKIFLFANPLTLGQVVTRPPSGVSS